MSTELIEATFAPGSYPHACWPKDLGGAAEPAATAVEATLLAKVLDEIDYGVAIVSLDGRVLHANVRARAEFADDRPLRLARDHLFARRTADQSALLQALQAVSKCRRSLVSHWRRGQPHLDRGGADRRRTANARRPPSCSRSAWPTRH